MPVHRYPPYPCIPLQSCSRCSVLLVTDILRLDQSEGASASVASSFLAPESHAVKPYRPEHTVSAGTAGVQQVLSCQRRWQAMRCGAGAGVLVRQEGKGHWAALKRAFRLLVDDVDDQNPTDAAYVFSGHCPLSVRHCARPCAGPACPASTSRARASCPCLGSCSHGLPVHPTIVRLGCASQIDLRSDKVRHLRALLGMCMSAIVQ